MTESCLISLSLSFLSLSITILNEKEAVEKLSARRRGTYANISRLVLYEIFEFATR